MKQPQRIVLSIIIILVIILVIIIGIFMKKTKKDKVLKEYTLIEEPTLEEKLKIVEVRNSYYVVKKCVDKFYSYYMTVFNIEEYYYQENDETVLKEAEQQNAMVLYNMLDKEYIQAKDVTNDNIKTKLSEIKKSDVDIIDMFVSQKTDNIEVYVVKGTLREINTGVIKPFQIIVELDIRNQTFSVIPQEYVEEKYENLSVGGTLEIIVPQSIIENKNNTFKYNSITDETYVKDLFSQLKNQIQYSAELAYNNLDEEYKNKKFGTFERFKEYIQNNNEKYSKMQIKEYQRKVINGNTRYVCVDQSGNYYIFNETAPMQYTLILDTYTIDLPEFTERYGSSDKQQKVALNIDKFFQALNEKDYNYAYNCLADSYKNNYFKTQEEFENYARENFYASSTVEFKEFNVEGELYTYSVILTDENTGEQMKKTFIMQLGQGTEFVLSFDR